MNIPTPPAPDPSQLPAWPRRAVVGVVGVAAAAAGVGLASWRLGLSEPGDATAGSAFWTSEFETPAGAKLDMRRFKGQRLFLNFWATWCPPCVEELPLIDSYFSASSTKSLQFLALALDKPEAVKAFLARRPLKMPVAIAAVGGLDLAKSMGNLVGGLPFTVILDAQGRIVQRKMGPVLEAELKAWTL